MLVGVGNCYSSVVVVLVGVETLEGDDLELLLVLFILDIRQLLLLLDK